MYKNQVYFCWNDGYLFDKANKDKPCPVCGGTNIKDLFGQMNNIYNWGFPMSLYKLPDKRKFLSCRNAIVCRKCGEVQKRSNKVCIECGNKKFDKFSDLYGEIEGPYPFPTSRW